MATDHKGPGHNRDHNFITEPVIIDRAAFNQGQNAQYRPHIEHSQTMDSLVARGPHAVLFENHPNDSRVTGPHEVAPSCVSRFGTGGGNVPLVQEAIAFKPGQSAKARTIGAQLGVACTIEAGGGGNNRQAVAVDVYNQKIDGDKAATLTKACGGTNTSGAKVMAVDCYNKTINEKSQAISSSASDINHTGGVINPKDRMAVRRLTPRECERLQGFPDDHTLIPWRNKPADQCPDGPRYKALGNSMAVPCMRWIGERIARAENERQGAA